MNRLRNTAILLMSFFLFTLVPAVGNADQVITKEIKYYDVDSPRRNVNEGQYGSSVIVKLPNYDYDKIIGGTEVVGWNYKHTIDVFDALKDIADGVNVDINIGGIGTTVHIQTLNGRLKHQADVVTDNGFGLVRSYQVLNNQEISNGWYCNDSWSSAATACNVPQCPEKWDQSHVKHWNELGSISTVFYGGWSCDYNGTALGATWAGIGKGHK